MQDTIEQSTTTRAEKTTPKLGQIRIYAGETIPDGWLLCDHRMLRRRVYPKLFRVIGTKYGDGDGSNTAFNLPNIVSPESDTRSIIFVGLPNIQA
jgi:microcystin-dependent protein